MQALNIKTRYFTKKRRFIAVLLLVTCLLQCAVKEGYAGINKLDYVGVLPKKPLKAGKDTTRNFNVFSKWFWDITLIDENRKEHHYYTSRWDTTETPDDVKITKAYYKTMVHVNPTLLHKIHVS